MESNVDAIREEYLRVSPSLTSDYDSLQDHSQSSSSSSSTSNASRTLHEGQWDWYTYLSKGNIQGHFVLKFPETSRILNEGLRKAQNNFQLFEGTPFGFVFFSSLGPGAKVAPHTGPSNLRLRIHLPIIAPKDKDDIVFNEETGLPKCGLRVGNSVRAYQYNNSLVFDDAYDHEVWNETKETRVVLLLDIWHPDIAQIEKEAIVEMFQTAKRDGLWKR